MNQDRELKPKLLEGEPAVQPFYPNHIFREMVVFLIVLVIVMLAAWFKGAPLEAPADPSATNYNPRPEWYFLWLFQLLKYFPGPWEPVGTFVIPGLIFLVLILLPFLDRSPYRHPLRRPWVTYGGGGFVALVLGLTILGAATAPPPPEQIAQEEEFVPAAQLDPVEIYRTNACNTCHSINGYGGDFGPDLTWIGKRMDRTTIRQIIRNPEDFFPEANMPPYDREQISDLEMEVLLDWLMQVDKEYSEEDLEEDYEEEFGYLGELTDEGLSDDVADEALSSDGEIWTEEESLNE